MLFQLAELYAADVCEALIAYRALCSIAFSFGCQIAHPVANATSSGFDTELVLIDGPVPPLLQYPDIDNASFDSFSILPHSLLQMMAAMFKMGAMFTTCEVEAIERLVRAGLNRDSAAKMFTGLIICILPSGSQHSVPMRSLLDTHPTLYKEIYELVVCHSVLFLKKSRKLFQNKTGCS